MTYVTPDINVYLSIHINIYVVRILNDIGDTSVPVGGDIHGPLSDSIINSMSGAIKFNYNLH